MPNYRFEHIVPPFNKGDVVPPWAFPEFSQVKHLLKAGAIKETNDPATILLDKPELTPEEELLSPLNLPHLLPEPVPAAPVAPVAPQSSNAANASTLVENVALRQKVATLQREVGVFKSRLNDAEDASTAAALKISEVEAERDSVQASLTEALAKLEMKQVSTPTPKEPMPTPKEEPKEPETKPNLPPAPAPTSGKKGNK